MPWGTKDIKTVMKWEHKNNNRKMCKHQKREEMQMAMEQAEESSVFPT